MVIRYPNGHLTTYDGTKTKRKQAKIRATSFSNRGMRFEEAINESNNYYLARGRAVIHKKPTPVQIVTVDYPKRSAAVIKEAYFKEASTTDYNGVYLGHYLDFEAKETKNKTSFPLKNIHLHQINHMKACLNHQAICFLLVWFSSLDRCFFLDAVHLIKFWDNKEHSRQSISLSFFERNGLEIQQKFAPRIDFLAAVDHYLSEKENHN